jgi:DNA (cytosine-5)-methyltransferase 1
MNAADLFCGAGGTSTGMVQAAIKRGLPLDLVAINHWPTAVKTHARNHPWATHVCADLASTGADPNKLVPGGRLDILVASPECTHHSIARGGKPCSNQSRASAWHVLHWCERLDVSEVLVENVKEFQHWGPLDCDGRPVKEKKGITFDAWLAALSSLGYAVDWKIINSADFGSATSRKRLFVRASKTGDIVWPVPTHSLHGEEGLSPWKPARDIIDWDLKGKSIFDRKKPLKDKTLARIEAGLRKFGGEAFIACLRGTADSQSGSWAASVDDPLKTISAGGVHAALCQPFVVNVAHAGGDRVKSCDEPLGTIPAGHRGEFGLCEPFVIGQQSGASPRSTKDPLPTIATAGAIALCQPFLTKYYGTAKSAQSVLEPLDTVTAKSRFALVEPREMDILFRMLKPHELAAAMGFEDYEFEGNTTEKVRQIGNAVAVEPAEALCGSMMDQLA